MKRKVDFYRMPLDLFMKKVRATRIERRIQVTAQFSHTRSCGTVFYVYIGKDDLLPINPYSKKDSGKKYVTFRSEVNGDIAKRMAWEYIQNELKGFLEPVC